MRDDDSYEGRLRELLRDPGWSLPPRPDAQARIRRSARRQRITLTGLAACTGAAATAVAVPLALSGGGDQGTHATPAAAGHASATRSAPGHPATVLMPDVTGLDLKQAETVILSVTTHGHITILRIKATQATGVVIRQAPSPGARVATDSQITLTVPKGS